MIRKCKIHLWKCICDENAVKSYSCKTADILGKKIVSLSTKNSMKYHSVFKIMLHSNILEDQQLLE